MRWNKIIPKLLVLSGLLVLEFYGACAAYYWIVPANPTDLYLQRMSGGARPFPVAVGQPPPDWHISLARYNSFFRHDWRLHIEDYAFGLVQFESRDWAVWFGRGGYMIHFTSPAFVLLTAASAAFAVFMFRKSGPGNHQGYCRQGTG
jgi:hypothetical protein